MAHFDAFSCLLIHNPLCPPAKANQLATRLRDVWKKPTGMAVERFGFKAINPCLLRLTATFTK